MREIALFSAWEKEGLSSIARALVERGMEIVATGNTRKLLEEEGFRVQDISDLTGEPERFGGRLKTLHHKVFGGILFRPDRDEAEWPENFRIAAVVCNFYPFTEKARDCETLNEMMEWVDIGGPSMVRAAAKNNEHVWVFTRKEQYTRFIAAPKEMADYTAERQMRRRFALEAFEAVTKLDEAIARHTQWMILGPDRGGGPLVYGENQHQKAHFVAAPSSGLKVYGHPSFNNLRDAEAAFRFVSAFKYPAVSVIKHQTLCGAAAGLGTTPPSKVFHWAWEGDPVSRFGGIIGLNFLPGAEIQEVLRSKFLEVIVMPRNAGSEKLAADLTALKPKLRFVLVDPSQYEASLKAATHPVGEEIFQGHLGRLVQQPDALEWDPELDAHDPTRHFHRFGQWAAACSKSNAMVLAGHDAATGVSYLAGTGQGQPNRLDALQRLALPRALNFAERMSVSMSTLTCFSDAFLSHADSIVALQQAGIRRLVQPGGSKADAQIAEEAERAGIEMKITGRRHFWH
ncbi:MAG: hypothetical protein JST16_03400 [Bdellovibrionales bacterium]|nr:hypothetical protein [Bdellovibrionales bacterium]